MPLNHEMHLMIGLASVACHRTWYSIRKIVICGKCCESACGATIELLEFGVSIEVSIHGTTRGGVSQRRFTHRHPRCAICVTRLHHGRTYFHPHALCTSQRTANGCHHGAIRGKTPRYGAWDCHSNTSNRRHQKHASATGLTCHFRGNDLVFSPTVIDGPCRSD